MGSTFKNILNIKIKLFFTSILSRNIREIFYFTDITDYPVENQINDFLRGKFYVNVASAAWPNGSIRGQLEAGVIYSILLELRVEY